MAGAEIWTSPASVLELGANDYCESPTAKRELIALNTKRR